STGGVVSRTVTRKTPCERLPEASVAVHTTGVVRIGKTEPEGGVHTTTGCGSTSSVAVTVYVTTAPVGSVASTVKSPGRGSTGGVVSTKTVKVNGSEYPLVRPASSFTDCTRQQYVSLASGLGVYEVPVTFTGEAPPKSQVGAPPPPPPAGTSSTS